MNENFSIQNFAIDIHPACKYFQNRSKVFFYSPQRHAQCRNLLFPCSRTACSPFCKDSQWKVITPFCAVDENKNYKSIKSVGFFEIVFFFDIFSFLFETRKNSYTLKLPMESRIPFSGIWKPVLIMPFKYASYRLSPKQATSPVEAISTPNMTSAPETSQNRN